MTTRSAAATITLAMILAMNTSVLGAEGPEPQTLRGWRQYVAATESRISRELGASTGFLLTDFGSEGRVIRRALDRGTVTIGKLATTDVSGRVIRVPGGTIAHWRGAVFLPSISLDLLLHRLQHPDRHAPQQEDVVWLRVLDRAPDRLTLAIRLTRSHLVSVTYDTEHVTTYRRLTTTRAASTSASRRIVEVADAGTPSERVLPDGQGRGLLWRMNSYWRYEAVGGGVIVELESLTLSRAIPTGLGLIVEPIVDRIARESIIRTLANVRRQYAADGGPLARQH
jgi:hypothetical protein